MNTLEPQPVAGFSSAPSGRRRPGLQVGLYAAAVSVFCIVGLLGAICGALWFRSEVAEPFRMPGTSMVPTLLPGDWFLVDKSAYRRAPPARGEVVVFWVGEDEGRHVPADLRPDLPRKALVKRIVATPGDRIRVGLDSVVLNGQPLEVSTPVLAALPGGERELRTEVLDGVSHLIARDPGRELPEAPEQVVPAERYFVLGDDRDHSRDSRHWGTIHVAELIGPASGILFSVDPASRQVVWSRIGERIE